MTRQSRISDVNNRPVVSHVELSRPRGVAKVKSFDTNLALMISRPYECHKLWSKFTPTGARPDRRELNRMLGKVAPGDIVMMTRIDRLARSTFDLFGIVKRIVDAKAQIRSLAEPWTGTSTGRLMLAVLGGLADVERDLIRTRTAEGRSRAKARGKHMGRPPSLPRHSRKTPPYGARRALRCRNRRTATTAALPPCAALRAPCDYSEVGSCVKLSW
jgi:hypothetical protein